MRGGPIRVALIGLGVRARKLYLPLLPAIAPWMRLAAVCTADPAKADAAAAEFGVPAFTSVDDLAAAGIAEAALVLSSIESHHAISLHLSRHGIHHLVETTMCSLLGQAEEMVAAAEANDTRVLVAENYFRFPFDRLARAITESGAVGDIGRVTCFHDQAGFHGTARWIHFFGGAPESVQSIRHTMATERHVESARRIHRSETFRSNILNFADGRTALDMGGNLKGLLGRTPRPGHTEICGGRGAIVRGDDVGDREKGVVRACTDEALARDGKADIMAPMVDVIENGVWLTSHADLPGGRVEWTNESRPPEIRGARLRPWDGAIVMAIVTEFARHVRGERQPEFTLRDALATARAEALMTESAHRGGSILPFDVPVADLETEAHLAADLKTRFGVDPRDADAVRRVHFAPAA